MQQLNNQFNNTLLSIAIYFVIIFIVAFISQIRNRADKLSATFIVIITILFFIFNVFNLSTVFGQCPAGGDMKGSSLTAKNHRMIDSFKNRGLAPAYYAYMPFDSLMGYKLDNPIKWDIGIYMDGYVLEIQDGGKESCNCHSATNKDTHIYIVSDKSVVDKSMSIIVEATPRFRESLGTTHELRKYIGKHVRLYGWLFCDAEHKANSTVDMGNGLHWRHTTFEIHPLTGIEILP